MNLEMHFRFIILYNLIISKNDERGLICIKQSCVTCINLNAKKSIKENLKRLFKVSTNSKTILRFFIILKYKQCILYIVSNDDRSRIEILDIYSKISSKFIPQRLFKTRN